MYTNGYFNKKSLYHRRRAVLAEVRRVHAPRDRPLRAGGSVVGEADAAAPRGRTHEGDPGQQMALGRAAVQAEPTLVVARSRQGYAGEDLCTDDQSS